jgi:hypothetical protein
MVMKQPEINHGDPSGQAPARIFLPPIPAVPGSEDLDRLRLRGYAQGIQENVTQSTDSSPWHLSDKPPQKTIRLAALDRVLGNQVK